MTNDRRTDAPGSTSTAIRGVPEGGAPPGVVTCSTLAGAPDTAARAVAPFAAGRAVAGLFSAGPFTAGAFAAVAAVA